MPRRIRGTKVDSFDMPQVIVVRPVLLTMGIQQRALLSHLVSDEVKANMAHAHSVFRGIRQMQDNYCVQQYGSKLNFRDVSIMTQILTRNNLIVDWCTYKKYKKKKIYLLVEFFLLITLAFLLHMI